MIASTTSMPVCRTTWRPKARTNSGAISSVAALPTSTGLFKPARRLRASRAGRVLLGEGRQRPLNRYLGRLSAYFDVLAAPAISGALQAWSKVATEDSWRRNNSTQLREQVRRFYAILVAGQDPQSYVQPGALVRHWRIALTLAKAFWFELTLLIAALGAAAGLGWLLSQGGGTTAGKWVLGVFTALGIPIATVRASLKNSTQALLKRLRSVIYADLVSEGVTIVPDKAPSPLTSPKRAAAKEVRTSVRNRALNPSPAAPLQ